MFNYRRGGVGMGSFPTLTKLFDLITITIGIGSSLISGERSREGIRWSRMMGRPWTCHWWGRVGVGLRGGVGGGEGFRRGDGGWNVSREGLYVGIEGWLHDWGSVSFREGRKGSEKEGKWVWWGIWIYLLISDWSFWTRYWCCEGRWLISALALSEREEKDHDPDHDHKKEGRKEKWGRKRNMMCTYLRSKLDHRSARLRKIKCKVYKVWNVKCEV
jgi:hypothetical protein